jgi:hypothetical protein
MQLPEVLKNKGVIIGVAVAALILILVVSKKGGNAPAGSSYYTGPGTLTSQQAVELASQGINASLASEQIAAGLKANLANIAALKSVNINASNNSLAAQRSINSTSLSESQIVATVENKQIAANAAAAAGTNATLLSLAGIEAQLQNDLAPSWESDLLNGPGAINLQNQSGALARTSANDSPIGGSGGNSTGLASILSLFG